MEEKLLRKIMSHFAGADAEKLVDLFAKKNNVNEYLIAKKLNVTINQTRNILYKLADGGLVRFIRKKDSKKGGWYIYFWSLDIKKSFQKYKETLEEQVRSFENQIKLRQSKMNYLCPNCEIEYNEESALLNDYICPECGGVLELQDQTKLIEAIQKEITKLQEVITVLNGEIAEIESKEEKTKERIIKKEIKKKAEEKAKAKKERERLKKKATKNVKPVVKKAQKKKVQNKKLPPKKSKKKGKQ